MAWRVEQSVARGEIDNRIRGRVTGRIWFVGRAAPVELDFAGNAWRDLAGRKLEFVNPSPKEADLSGFSPRQSGVIGDCTASRKVRVPDVSEEELAELYRQRKPFPWHWGNSLYLEWFSNANGRVVIESANYQLTIGDDIAWEMSAAEEAQQRGANSEALTHLFDKLAHAIPASATPEGGETPDDSDDDKPLTETEAERMQENSDILADRITARVEREGDENFERILEEELERRRRERGEEPLTPEPEEEREDWIEEMNRTAAEAAANPDPELEEVFERKHPVAERALELSLRLIHDTDNAGWIPDDAPADHAVADLISSVMSASAKFAGALNGAEWPPSIQVCAGAIVRLKRARSFLDHASLAATHCIEHKLADVDWLKQAGREIGILVNDADLLVAELRAKLDRGFD